MSIAKAPSQRQLRVGESLRHALSEVLRAGNLRDPALSGASITVTEVRASPDLKNATAFVMPLGGADLPEVLAALRRAAPFLRREMGKKIELRYTPALTFLADTSFDEAARIDDALNDPAVASAVADWRRRQTDSVAEHPSDDA